MVVGDQTDPGGLRATPGGARWEKRSEPSSWQTHFITMWPRGPSLLPGKQQQTPGLEHHHHPAPHPPCTKRIIHGQAENFLECAPAFLMSNSICQALTPSVCIFNPMVLKMRIRRAGEHSPPAYPRAGEGRTGNDPEPPKPIQWPWPCERQKRSG